MLTNNTGTCPTVLLVVEVVELTVLVFAARVCLLVEQVRVCLLEVKAKVVQLNKTVETTRRHQRI